MCNKDFITGSDCGSALWIKKITFLKGFSLLRSDSEDSSSHQTSLSTKSIELKNITAKRQQDSETSDVGLDGHVGNVKRHKDFICGIENIPMGPPLPEIEAANKENASLSNSIKLLKETLGPSSPPDER